MPTIYSKDTVQKALASVPPEKIPEYLEKSMIQCEKIPRDYGDYLISLILEKPLSLYPPNEITEIGAYMNDLSSISFDDSIRYVVAFDTETTGYTGYACSIALILYDTWEKKTVEDFYSLMNPGINIPADATAIHKISNEDVADEKSFDAYLSKIEAIFEKGDMFVGHNLQFDLKVLEREYERLDKVYPLINAPIFDTMLIGKRIMNLKDVNGKKLKNPQLGEAMAFYGIENTAGDYHNALVDTEATLKVFLKMTEIQEED